MQMRGCLELNFPNHKFPAICNFVCNIISKSNWESYGRILRSTTE